MTTIQPPTVGVQSIAHSASEIGSPVIVIGDRRSPITWQCAGTQYFSFEDQLSMHFALSSVLPANTYARKMFGYLIAAAEGADWIRETDDDNLPNGNFWATVPDEVLARVPVSAERWINVYRYFTDRHIWPRGFPLDRIPECFELEPSVSLDLHRVSGPTIFQALADGDPDVDAIFRMSSPDRSAVEFLQLDPLLVPSGVWTPFNSQATTWPRSLFPLMYLPSTCSFRMTDIWRSFVALRLMPGLEASLVITSPTVYQDRNQHDLMRDFRDEIEGYLNYEGVISTLEATPTGGGYENLLDDLRAVYEGLCAAGYFRTEELDIVDAWIADVRYIGAGVPA